MIDPDVVSRHYTRGDLLAALRSGVAKLGKTPETLTLDDLAPVDEFHIGGRMATRAFLDQLAIGANDRVLDIGCGIGGASRFAAQTYGCQVIGVDLTDEYVETGKVLCAWLGLDAKVELLQGSVLAMNLPDASVDKAFMLHVGMNIPDKAALAAEVWRVLKPGGVFGIYDIMEVNAEQLVFPVPWATVAAASSLAPPEAYRHALTGAGFEIVGERNRREFALEFFERLKTAAAAAGGPPPLGLHLLMGPDAPTKVQNMIVNVSQNKVAPVELIARKAPA
ncbi:class I SAM-dependent methyltransferase [Solimonas terrae]|uniref:Class I SAM-dependent methyltransferase n=1 Tax=Solimonas terrae TaxID=1396819 RepID=A0A6M2BRS3_9GAMM|nr:class I SAM-dependent methyltransferase [Solimonas terrae]NGY04729.1 class I SAM-dependent methyltransferase [Solimonas terrae]